MMKAVKYLAAPWVGVIVYVFLSIQYGAMGFESYRSLLVEKEKETANLENLKIINRELENTKNALLYDKDTLGVYARELGFARPNEKFIRIVGLGDPYKRRSDPGEVVTASPPAYIPDRTLRIAALWAALGTLILLGIIDFFLFVKNQL